MNNHRGLLHIRRMDRAQKVRIKKLCGLTKGVDERIVLRWFGHVERMENEMIGKRVSVLVIAQWVGRGRAGLIL